MRKGEYGMKTPILKVRISGFIKELDITFKITTNFFIHNKSRLNF